MPELPEVEITRRHLDAVLTGRRMEKVEVLHARTSRHNTSPAEVGERLKGRQVVAVQRHGKFLRIPLDDGQVVVAHLGMSGRWAVDADPEPHTHFLAELDDRTSVAFIDPRTFGFVAVYDEDDLGRSGLSRLGPDAWETELDAEAIHGSLQRRTAPIKALLLDQTIISGLGNIYADEVLFESKIHPMSPGRHLTIGHVTDMVKSTRQVLAIAIENGGTTLDDLAYLLPDGRAGDNLNRLAVYGREGEPCQECGVPIERIVVRARSTHFCPRCQERP